MARIERYEAQRALQPGNTPATQYSNALGQELEGAGAAVSDLAASFIQRQEQRENFKAENDYRRLKLELQQELETRAAEIEPGGDGFHEKFMIDAYKPKRDDFLSRVPARLRPQFETLLADDTGADTAEWSTRAATVERDETYRWQKQEISLTQEQLANAIALDPAGYDALLDDGRSLIEVSSLPTPEKEKMLVDWERMAQVSILNRLLQDDPQAVLRELGHDARNLSPQTQFSMLSRAVQWQESRDNPNAVSPKGAVGLMQVMPATAADIARKLGDESFPHGQSRDAVARYLSNPYTNKMYGEAYLQEQLRTFANTRNPIETALVAYNAGPSVAKRWVESGYDDSMLPKETRDYKKSIMDSMQAPYAKGDPSKVKFEGVQLDGVNPDLTSRVADAFSALGRDTVRVNSGKRDSVTNELAHGAKQSQHLDGNALDLDVSGMKIAERLELIKALSAAGVTGIGVYANAIHADLGGRRAWGPSHGAESVPKWAQGVIAEHLAGTTPPVRRVAGRYGSLPYDTAEQFRSKADQEISRQQTAMSKSTAVEKVQIRQQRDNELALIRATGQGSPNFDESAIATILGEDDYLKFTTDKDQAQRIYTATSDIVTMAEEDMYERQAMYAPSEGASDFQTQTDVYDAITKEISRVRQLRARSPDKGAIEFPDVAEAYNNMYDTAEGGVPSDPVSVQSFIRQMISTQQQFGTKPEAIAPVHREWALSIGKQLMDEIPVNDPKTQGVNETQIELMAFYTNAEKLFGPYTDDVIRYAVAEYNALDPVVATTITSAMERVARGSDPFRRLRVELDSAEDLQQVESLGGGWGSGMNPLDFFFPPGAGETEIEEDEGLSVEERRRRQELESF